MILTICELSRCSGFIWGRGILYGQMPLYLYWFAVPTAKKFSAYASSAKSKIFFQDTCKISTPSTFGNLLLAYSSVHSDIETIALCFAGFVIKLSLSEYILSWSYPGKIHPRLASMMMWKLRLSVISKYLFERWSRFYILFSLPEPALKWTLRNACCKDRSHDHQTSTCWHMIKTKAKLPRKIRVGWGNSRIRQ